MNVKRCCWTWPRMVVAALLLIAAAVIGVLLTNGGKLHFALKDNHVAARVLVPVLPQRILDEPAASRPTADEIERERHTQIQLAKSRMVINAALRNPKVATLSIIREQTDPTAFVEENLSVDFVEKSDVLRIALNAGTVEEQTAIVSAIAAQYVQEVNGRDANFRRARLDKLSEVHAELDMKLQERRRVLKHLSEDGERDKAAARRNFDQELARKQLASIQDELVKLDELDRKLKLEFAERGSGAAAVSTADVAKTAALLKLERQRKFLFDERDKQLALLETLPKRVGIDWLTDEVNSESVLLARVAAQRQSLQIDMHAPGRAQLLDDAGPEH